MIAALSNVPVGQPVVIVTDSEYVVKGVTQWSKAWMRSGWCKADGSEVLNRDLWEVLIELFSAHTAHFQLVKGHNGNAGNETVDRMCTNAIRQRHSQIRHAQE